MTTLRYTGEYPTTFAEFRIGMVEPGDEFGVPDDQAETYTRRADIEVVESAESATEAPKPEDDTPEPEPAGAAPEAAPEPAVADTEAADVAPDTDTSAAQ